MIAKNGINPKTTLVVDWSYVFEKDEGTEISEYDTSVTPFNILKNGTWKSTEYETVDHIESFGGDVIWSKDHAV